MRANKLIKQYFKKCWNCNGNLQVNSKTKHRLMHLCTKCNFISMYCINSLISARWFHIELGNLLLIFSNYEVKIYCIFNENEKYNIIDKQNFNSRLKGLKYFYNFYKKFKQNEVFL